MTRTDASDDDGGSTDRLTITQQYAFSFDDGETDGTIEPSEETVETDLGTWGADIDHRERDSRIDQPEATSFGVDDRPEVTSSDGGEQGALFVDTTDDQQTLTGERAASQCLFETDDGNDETDEYTTGDESAIHEELAASVSDESTTNRTVATDGGCVKDSNDHESDTNNRSERSEQSAADTGKMVAIPRMELARVGDALDEERRTIEYNAGKGPKTETLADWVEEYRVGLSLLAINDEIATITRDTAAAAADDLEAAAKTETGDYAEELRELSDGLRYAFDEQSESG